MHHGVSVDPTVLVEGRVPQKSDILGLGLGRPQPMTTRKRLCPVKSNSCMSARVCLTSGSFGETRPHSNVGLGH